MPAEHEHREKLYELLNRGIDQAELRVLCNIYLNVIYDNLSGDTKALKLSELIDLMERQNKTSLFCHKIIKMRPDLEDAIIQLGLITNDTQLYIDIATDNFLPLPGIEHVLRNPNKIYRSVKCADMPYSDQGEDTIRYIDRLLQEMPAVLIIGDYGTGKSFLTQKIFLENTDAHRSGERPNSRIPILLPLKQLVGSGRDLVLIKIIEHLRMLRFFRGDPRKHADERAEFEARLRAGEFLCILDGFDEIPLITMRLNPIDELNTILKALTLDNNQIIITSRPGILPGVLSRDFMSRIPQLGIGYLLPWKGEATWREYLRTCEGLGIDFGEQGYDGFGSWVLSKPELKQLTSTPLFCQMLVETRHDIMKVTDFNVAKLYETYVERYFENVSERSPIRYRFNHPEEEIEYKKNCLMATAVGMLESNVLRIAPEEIEEALLREAQEYGDDLLAAFTRPAILIYSLLIPDEDYSFSFSHKSFYDFFVALKIYKEILRGEDRFALFGRTLLSKEIITFFSGLLSFDNSVRTELNKAFETSTPLKLLNVHGENRMLLRNLALTQLDLVQRIEGVNLNYLNFNGYILSTTDNPRGLVKVSLDGSSLEGATLAGANLSGSRLRSAKLNRCILDAADLRDADLSGAELQDISCRDALFSGANFTGVILRKQDKFRIKTAINAERAVSPDVVDDAWVKKTEAILDRSVV